MSFNSRRILRSSRHLRSNSAFQELRQDTPSDVNAILNNYSDLEADDEYDETTNDYNDNTLLNDTTTDSHNTNNNNNNDGSIDQTSIPEVDVQEIIDMANEIIRNSDGSNRTSVRIRRFGRDLDFPTINDPVNVQSMANRLTARRIIDDRPLWMKIADSITFTLFPIILLRGIRNVMSLSSFSIDILQDSFEFIDYVHGSATQALSTTINNATNQMDKSTSSSSLIMKFGTIILEEFPNLGENIKIVITLSIFYFYNILFSTYMIASFAFLTLCLVCSVGRRWHSIEKLVVELFKNGEGCL
ncbi:hypothetical protein CANARDRAFT_30284 [[Candida] arabinofermentans NRRL YB-2248]|uniref:Uncharacterized protein n=1 Tax=[Candida] arabinofermentans NRRL YB-2248 TaxID=983967 RepID=A0A1E4SU63_9ASCO|nr:hypothetical protein CANARDRAFT_30284 [[Candida] arabinofermentans NRRL YB-2248]